MAPENPPPYSVVDTNWMGRSKSIAAVLVQSDGINALIDPGPTSTVENLRAELRLRGLSVEELHAILLTHIHLDHAGATGSLVKENPRIDVFVHEFGAPRIADPSKLVASATRLYGAEMHRLYGPVLPVPEENVRALAGGETVSVGKRNFAVLSTPGHASHHVSFWDAEDGVAFVGDVGGISVEGHEFVLPATPPPDIDIELWNQSLDAILDLQPQKLFLTHFGYVHNPARHIARYRGHLARWSAMVNALLESGKSEQAAGQEFVDAIAGETRSAFPPAEAD